MAQVDGVTARLSLLQTTDEGFAGELASLKSYMDELRQSIDALAKDVQSAKSEAQSAKNADAALSKRLDELSAKIAAVDQRLWVLEARYNDHLRRYHGG